MKLFRRHFDWSICFGLGWSISSVYAVTSGAIKIVDYHNANIYGDSKNGYYITDYYHHYPSGSLPDGWVEPNRKDIK